MKMNRETNNHQTRFLTSLTQGGGKIIHEPEGKKLLSVPPGNSQQYRVAQLDDYSGRKRNQFPWRPPAYLGLEARVSSQHIPGTWGFGWWNDPFALSFGFGGGQRRLPAIPNTAWFFFASPPNYLSFRDDKPAQGFLAATMRPRFKTPWLGMLSGFFLPLGLAPTTAPLFRRVAQIFIQEDSAQVNIDVTKWHHYEIHWDIAKVSFIVDNQLLFETNCTPHAPLGMVIWIDNQFAAFPPGGKLSYGFLENTKAAWLEFRALKTQAPVKQTSLA